MQKGQEAAAVFEELWQYACPKFISATAVNLNKGPEDDIIVSSGWLAFLSY
jgi:translation initiation factor 3 subunit L